MSLLSPNVRQEAHPPESWKYLLELAYGACLDADAYKEKQNTLRLKDEMDGDSGRQAV